MEKEQKFLKQEKSPKYGDKLYICGKCGYWEYEGKCLKKSCLKKNI